MPLSYPSPFDLVALRMVFSRLSESRVSLPRLTIFSTTDIMAVSLSGNAELCSGVKSIRHFVSDSIALLYLLSLLNSSKNPAGKAMPSINMVLNPLALALASSLTGKFKDDRSVYGLLLCNGSKLLSYSRALQPEDDGFDRVLLLIFIIPLHPGHLLQP